MNSEITECYNHTVSTPLRFFGPPPQPTTPSEEHSSTHSLHWQRRSKYHQRATGSSKSFWHIDHEMTPPPESRQEILNAETDRSLANTQPFSSQYFPASLETQSSLNQLQIASRI